MVTRNEPKNLSDVILVLSSCPADTAEEIAGRLVDEGHAACVNIIPQINSIYRWQGRVERNTETLMMIKCAANSYPKLEKQLLALHPYELPEIITVPDIGGLPEYLQWVSNPEQAS